MQEAIKDGGGDRGVIIEDARPLLVGRVGGDDDRAALIARADYLEEQIGSALVHGQITQLVDYQKPRSNICLQRLGQGVGCLGGGERVDDVHGGCEQRRHVVKAGGVRERDGQVGFAQTDAPDEHDIGVLFDKAQAEQILDLDAVDLAWPGPVELLQGLSTGRCAALVRRWTLRS